MTQPKILAVTRQVRSEDGTDLAYETLGSGPAVVLVDGAMCFRASGPMRPLADELAADLQVFLYDRRGRGESTDTPPYSVSKEVRDLEAVIDAAGGRAGVYAVSSGVPLALRAAADLGEKVSRLALYEPPFTESADDAGAREYSTDLSAAIADGRRADAVALFLRRVGMPEEMVQGARSAPSWPGMEALAPTLAYDDQQMGDSALPREIAAAVTQPSLVMAGEASPSFLRTASERLAGALDNAEYRSLPGQTHDAQPRAIAPPLVDFFGR